MMKLTTKPTLLCVIAFSGFPIGIGAQPQNSYDFFANRQTIEFNLRTDLVELLADRSQESQERPGEVSYVSPDGSPVMIPVQVKTRGSFRLDPNICDFPPIRLNFRRQDVPSTLFAGQDKMKMVTHCLTPEPEYQQFAILEYLVYRAYETLTPTSFRTRLAKVTYEDASGTFGAITRYAFLIEDVEDVAIRSASKVVEYEGFHPLLANEAAMSLFDIFQFMIGNTDWSVFLSQNVEFLEDSLGNVVVVPFDFDWSGAVAPPYAIPAPDVPTSDVKERFFMGVCRTGDPVSNALARMRAVRSEIYELYENETALTPELRAQTLSYFDEFYTIIGDRKLTETHIRKACRL